MNGRLCITCQEQIAESRLKALPNTRHCVKCSETKPVKGYMTWEHKTAPTFQVVSPEQYRVLSGWERHNFNASLPFNSMKNPFLVKAAQSITDRAEVRKLLHEEKPEPSFAERVDAGEFERLQVPTCKVCEKEPRATPSGHCVSCAARWYSGRKR